jgi:hypothetical protein
MLPRIMAACRTALDEALAAGRARRQLYGHLGFGRIIASEIEAPNILVNLV